MIKTYAKFNAKKNRTTPITVNGKTRWITADLAQSIEGWKQAAIADYAAKSGDVVTNSHRIFVVYQSTRFDYVLSVTGAGCDGPNLSVVASVLSISDVTKRYDADSRWQRVVAGINPISDLIA
jgi:Cft2 family RNA processing exonuclease